MATNTKLQNTIRTIKNIPQQVFRFVSSAAIRIFSPSDDNYPKTGVQPFEGEPSDEKSR